MLHHVTDFEAWKIISTMQNKRNVPRNPMNREQKSWSQKLLKHLHLNFQTLIQHQLHSGEKVRYNFALFLASFPSGCLYIHRKWKVLSYLSEIFLGFSISLVTTTKSKSPISNLLLVPVFTFNKLYRKCDNQ